MPLLDGRGATLIHPHADQNPRTRLQMPITFPLCAPLISFLWTRLSGKKKSHVTPPANDKRIRSNGSRSNFHPGRKPLGRWTTPGQRCGFSSQRMQFLQTSVGPMQSKTNGQILETRGTCKNDEIFFKRFLLLIREKRRLHRAALHLGDHGNRRIPPATHRHPPPDDV